MAFNAQTHVALAQYLAYVFSFWIGPNRFCAHADVNLTNNYIESWDRTFNQIMGHAHPSFWIFLGDPSYLMLSVRILILLYSHSDNLQIVGDEAERHLSSSSSGRYVFNQRRSYQQRDLRIARNSKFKCRKNFKNLISRNGRSFLRT